MLNYNDQVVFENKIINAPQENKKYKVIGMLNSFFSKFELRL